MKVKMQVTRKTIEEVEVEFPIYRKHDAGDEHTYIVYARLDLIDRSTPFGHQLAMRYQITKTNRGFEIEIGSVVLDGSDSGYTLGRGEYASNQKEFEEVLAEASEFLGRFMAKPRS